VPLTVRFVAPPVNISVLTISVSPAAIELL
jgi:hypothetical protein